VCERSRRRLGRHLATRSEFAGLSAQPFNVSRAISGHVPYPVVVLNESRHDPRLEVLGLIAPTRPVKLGRPVGGEVFGTDRAVRGPFAVHDRWHF